jgi:hypothetical protein
MNPIRILDVRDLEPPAPLQAVLAAIDLLQPGTSLLMRHRREPFPLYPMLAELDCDHRTSITADGTVEVLIWRRGRADPGVPT